MPRRAPTGLSFVVGIDKPEGMTSHDVVDAVRRACGERRVGHTGTLDPAATGAMAVCVGPAARLDRFLAGHDKRYSFSVVFGSSTSTDDAQGEVLHTAPVPVRVLDADFARRTVEGLVGKHSQMPPVYSAIKVGGVKAVDAARSGKVVDISPRDVEVYSAALEGLDAADPQAPVWHLSVHVSSGTYVRSIARDLGLSMGTRAHVGRLRRLSSGALQVSDCVGLDAFAGAPFASCVDPVRLLGYRFLFAQGALAAKVANGQALRPEACRLHAYGARSQGDACLCTSGVREADAPLGSAERVSVVVDNALAAIYEYDEACGMLKSCCGFATGVKRGSGT